MSRLWWKNPRSRKVIPPHEFGRLTRSVRQWEHKWPALHQDFLSFILILSAEGRLVHRYLWRPGQSSRVFTQSPMYGSYLKLHFAREKIMIPVHHHNKERRSLPLHIPHLQSCSSPKWPWHLKVISFSGKNNDLKNPILIGIFNLKLPPFSEFLLLIDVF